MNKIYKVIYSKVRNCYVAVSELAKSHDSAHGTRSRSGCCRKAAVLAAFVLTTSLLAAPDWAQAATATNTGNPSANQAVNIENQIETTAQGSDAYATYDSQGNLIVGKSNEVVPIQKDPKTGNARVDSKPENVVLGTRNGVGKFTHSTETKKPISGDASYAYEKLDTEWITVKVYNPDTNSYDDKQVEVYNLTPGQYMDDEYNVRAKKPIESDYSTDAQYQDALSVYNKVADYYKNDKTRQSYYVSGATAVGVDNVAEGNHSTAIGNKAKVLNSVGSFYIDKDQKLTRDSDAAYYFLKDGQITTEPQYVKNPDGSYYRDQKGYYVKTSFLTVDRLIDSSDAVAIGSDVTAEGRSAVAIGHQSYAKEYSVAIGENSVTDYMGVAIGKDNKAKYASTAIGHTNDANGYYTATMGVNNTARADESTAIGYGNSVDGQQNGGTTPKAAYTHVLGSNNTVKGNYNAVFGDTNTVTGAYALALGGHNKISGENTVGADGDYGIAIGYSNTVEKNALALGLNSNSIHDGSIAIGNQVNTTGDNNNGATNSIAIGTKASVHMKNGIVLGNEAYAGNNGNNSEGAIAIGHQAKSAAGESIAIGTQATTGNNVGSTGMTNIGAIAIGSNSTADTVYDIAMGWGANTKNTANGGAIALGHNATIEQGGQASAAIGDSARVKENLHDAVALGSQSYAERTANNQGGYDPESDSKNHNAGSDPVWNSTLAAVSVGSSDHYVWDGTKNIHYAQQTRQITNVAAGKEDTDAVNVAQLKQVVNLVHNGGGSGTGGSGVHDYSVKSVNPGTDNNYNNGGASGDNALAAGVNASATGAHSVAVGNGATAKGQDSIALGTGAVADGIGATAIGQYNTASGQNSLAFGGGYNKGQKGNTASGVASVAFGERTEASGESATAFGSDSTASGKNAAAFGENSTASGEASTAFGIGSTAAAKNSLAALGGTVDEKATNAAAIGNGAQAKLADTVALGSGSVASRARYRDLTVEAEKAAYAKGNSHGAAWEATANAIAIGNDNTVTRQLTGVAAGSLDTDAVNVAQLKKMAAEGLDFQGNNDVTVHRDLGQKLTIRGEGTKADTNYSGENLKVIGNTDGSLTIKMDKDIKGNSVTVGKKGEPGTPGKDGVDGTIGVNGKDGSAVVINGKDGSIGLKGQDGANGLTIKGADGAVGVDGTDGHDGKDGMTRIVYEDNNKITHEVATLDDGLKFGGDFGTDSAVKLNQKLTVTGGETNPDNLATANNIGVVSSQDGDNGKLELKLNKDLTGLNTVTAGTAKIGHHADGVLDTVQNGQPTGVHAKGGEFVTGLTNKEWTVKDPTYVSGRAATEDELRIVSDAVSGNTTKITNNTTQITNNTNTIAKGLSFTTNTKDASNTGENYKGYKVVKRSLGDTIAIKASDETGGHDYSTANLTTRIAENGDISILMDEKPTFTTVTTGDVIYTGNPDNKDNNGKAAQADTSVHYGDKTLTDGKNITTSDNETKATRLGYDDAQGLHHDIATMDDGQIYAGDIKTDGTLDSNGFARTMNQKTTINGGVTNKDNLTDNNIGVVSNGTDTLTVKLAKELKDLTSVTTGKTVQNDSGITITNDKTDETKNVVINGDKISFGGNQVNNMGSGSDGTDADKNLTYNTLTNGANIGDVKNIANTTVQPVIDTVNKGWELDVNGKKQKAVTPTNPKVNLIQGQNITITGDIADTDNVTISTADDVRFNTVRVGGVKTGDTYSGGIVIGVQSGKNADGTESANSNDDYYITGLKNTNWDSKKIQSGRAATEDQLQAVADEIRNGTVKGDVYVSGGAVTYNGEGTDTKTKDGKGSISLTRQNGTDVHIDGLHDYYITDGTVTNDGKTLELTRNDVDADGNHQKVTVDLSNVLKHDLHLVQNPAAGSAGKYTVDTKTGTVTLKVQNADGTDASDITIGGFEGLGKGLKFGANQKVAENGSNPVTNQLGSIINITGDGDKTLDKYSGKNLLTSVEQDAEGNTTIHVLMDKNISADSVVVGQEGKAGKDGKDGYIGINGKDGADGITTTTIRTEKGQSGADGTNGKPGVDGKDITRIVYQNGQDGTDGKDTHTVATLDDGLKFAGDDGQNDDMKVINKKLNERLDIVGKAQGDLTDANIGVTKDDNGKLYIQLAKHVNLDGDGTLQAGDAKIGHFTNTELTTNKGDHPADGSYTIGLGNKDWNVDSPDYVSGRAATEDQLAKVSEAITNASTAAGKRTVVTVNDKSNPAVAEPGANAYGEYDSQNGNLMIAAKRDSDGLMTYNIKLNDNLTIGQKGADGQDGKDGNVTVETKGGTTVVIGHDGKDGEDGKDGISVKGKDGKDGVTIGVTNGTDGTDGSEGHIGLTGPAGKDGKNASADIHVKNGQNGVDGTDGNNGKDGMDRVVYEDHNGKTHEVATMDDGLKFVGNDGQEVIRKLNETLSIKGGLSNTDVAKASSKNLGVRKGGDGLEIVMTDTPDFTKVTVGEGTDTNSKITIGKQTVTGKKADGSDADKPQTGNYITGLDNKAWDKDNVVADRAATESQLKDAINDISGKDKGGFGLADEKGSTVKKNLGETIAVKGDDKNIETKVNGDALEVSLKKDVVLGDDGSLKAGNTTIDKNGVNTNEVKVGNITINDKGINGGTKQITNIGSGIDGKQYATAGDNNAASIGDVKQLAQKEAKASEAKSSKNITVNDDHTVNLNDDIILGNDSNKQVAINGSNGQVVIGSGDSAMTLGKQANTAGDSNPENGNYLNGLDNKKWDGEHIQSGRAATEDQLKTVSDKVNSGRKFQGDDGKDVTVDLGKTLNIKGGATAVSDANNVGIVRGDDNTLNVRLAKDLTGLNSVTTGNTTINNSGLTVKGDDNHKDITIHQDNVNMGGNKITGVAPGAVTPDSTDAVNGSQLYAAGQAISNLGGAVNKLGTRVDRVGAGAAALAALHPLDFDPDDKWDFAAGYGNYRSANAAAVGAYYRPNEDTMFSIGGSFGGGENMFNAGVSIKLGQGNHISTSRVAMAKEMEAMRRHMAEQDALIAKLESMHGMAEGPEKSVLFPDVAENHWAYQYVTALAKKGLLEGYPDGEFKGDRMMTRYEFAAIVYRIVESGAGSMDPELSKLVKEFSPELQYIRIDTIHRDDNGQPTVQRVRVKDRK